MTFQEPEVEPDPHGDGENYPPEPSILDVKLWLDWQAHQICHVGGQNSEPSQGWKTHRNSPGRSGPPSQFPRSEARSSQGKIILHPLPLSTSPRTCSSQMNYLIRMYDSSLFSSLSLMPKDCSIGQRNSICQRTQIPTPW